MSKTYEDEQVQLKVDTHRLRQEIKVQERKSEDLEIHSEGTQIRGFAGNGMTEAMPFMQKAILLSYVPRPLMPEYFSFPLFFRLFPAFREIGHSVGNHVIHQFLYILFRGAALNQRVC